MEYLDSIKSQSMKEKVLSGEIHINTKDDFKLPKTQYIPLITKNKSALYRLKVWLVDNHFETIIEDYYFYMDWLPGKPIIKIPRGFVFNGASIHKSLRFLFSPKGILYAASLFHDFGYEYNTYLTIDNELYFRLTNRDRYDKVFRTFNEQVYGFGLIAYITWIAVRIGGYTGWLSYREADADYHKFFVIK